MTLKRRRQELEAMATQQGIAWEQTLEGMPDDNRLKVAALATLLRLDPYLATREDVQVNSMPVSPPTLEHDDFEDRMARAEQGDLGESS